MLREFEDRLLEAVAAQQVVDRAWDSLTDQQTIIASYLMEGLAPIEIADNIGCSRQSVACVIDSMRKKFIRAGGE